MKRQLQHVTHHLDKTTIDLNSVGVVSLSSSDVGYAARCNTLSLATRFRATSLSLVLAPLFSPPKLRPRFPFILIIIDSVVLSFAFLFLLQVSRFKMLSPTLGGQCWERWPFGCDSGSYYVFFHREVRSEASL